MYFIWFPSISDTYKHTYNESISISVMKHTVGIHLIHLKTDSEIKVVQKTAHIILS